MVAIAAGGEPSSQPARAVTFAELAACPLFGPGEERPLPKAVSDARDRRIRMTGYLLPLRLDAGRVREFLLMRNQAACCYGTMPAANEFVVAEARGAGLPLTMDVPVTVQGTLRIAPLIIDGAHAQFYRLDEARLFTP